MNDELYERSYEDDYDDEARLEDLEWEIILEDDERERDFW